MKNAATLDRIVEAVLYEGYILYPYRASSRKNRERFTFGRVYPRDYHNSQNGAEACTLITECLAERKRSDSPPRLRVEVRFLQPVRRNVGVLDEPMETIPNQKDPPHRLVSEFTTGGQCYSAWHEAVERSLALDFELEEDVDETMSFEIPPSHRVEGVTGSEGKFCAILIRDSETLEGEVFARVKPVSDSVYRISVKLTNLTAWDKRETENRDTLLMRTFASTHVVLHAEGAAFISQTDPPEGFAEAARNCRNEGAWPVLIGDESKKDRDIVLASPIILEDYPKIAPESEGNLFDGLEIDEILSLRILTMTDDEKTEMRGVDEQARRLLERTESLGPDSFLKMHGTFRDTVPIPHESEISDPFDQYIFGPKSEKIETVTVQGVRLREGDRIVVRPKVRADAIDMMLAGKTAEIEAIEIDAEGKIHVAVLVDDDPGKDLGALRQPGHRFFYGADEIEPAAKPMEVEVS